MTSTKSAAKNQVSICLALSLRWLSKEIASCIRSILVLNVILLICLTDSQWRGHSIILSKKWLTIYRSCLRSLLRLGLSLRRSSSHSLDLLLSWERCFNKLNLGINSLGCISSHEPSANESSISMVLLTVVAWGCSIHVIAQSTQTFASILIV